MYIARGLCITVLKEHPLYSTHRKTKKAFIRYLITSCVLLTFFIIFMMYLTELAKQENHIYNEYFGMFVLGVVISCVFLFGTLLGLAMSGREINRFGKLLPDPTPNQATIVPSNHIIVDEDATHISIAKGEPIQVS